MIYEPIHEHWERAATKRGIAFTLIELLIVLGVMALLLALLLPNLAKARALAKASVCGSNVRQLGLANLHYAYDHSDSACPGAADFLRNLHRWHGMRQELSEPFDATRGPLVAYLGASGSIRDCPSFDDFHMGEGAFELGNGGYGYNNAFIGVRLREMGGEFYLVETDQVGANLTHIRSPGKTIMFTDAALVSAGLIEYSFAEPRFHPTSGFRADPSIHFRHLGKANVAYCDGHVARCERTFTWSSGVYPGDPDSYEIGWLGTKDDNSLFDLK